MKCPLCATENKISFISKDKIFYNCKKCDSIYLDKKNYVDLNEEKERYSSHNNSSDNKGYLKMLKKFMDDTVMKVSTDVNEILDYGCGPGPILSELLEKEGFNVDLYDPIFYPDTNDKLYDLVTSTEVFEHFHDPVENINKILNKIKSNGYLAIMTYFHDGVDIFKEWFYKEDPTHVFFYNTNTFKYIANKFNLEVIFNDSTKHILFKKYD